MGDSAKGCMLGAFMFSADGRFPDDGRRRILDFEALIGKKLAQTLWFITFDDMFPAEGCAEALAAGTLPQVTWELFFPSREPSNTVASAPYLDELLGGAHDAYIERFARDVKAFGGPVLIRFLHEMNGSWYVWGGEKNGGARSAGGAGSAGGGSGPAKVVAAWRRVVDAFRSVGADNARWVWCPHGPSGDVTKAAWNAASAYYPGADYVDWLGFDQYNWYPDDPWGGKRPYFDWDNSFRLIYEELLSIDPRKPISISEFACGEYGIERGRGLGKPEWIAQTFAAIKASPSVKLVSWFHIKKEKDWRVDSSPESLAAFREAVADPHFSSDYRGFIR
jgi:beta-mannanase